MFDNFSMAPAKFGMVCYSADRFCISKSDSVLIIWNIGFADVE